ncbi:MAG: hypothetical protein ACLT8E_10485 [Akkermansia sp.]
MWCWACRNPDEDHEPFEAAIAAIKEERYGNADVEDTKLSADDLKELVSVSRRWCWNAPAMNSECPWAFTIGAVVPGTMTAPSFTASRHPVRMGHRRQRRPWYWQHG